MARSKSLNLGAKLQQLRRQSGLSVKQIAAEIGVAQSTYRDWEYGRAIRGEPYADLAKVFGVSLSELLAGQLGFDRAEILKKLTQIEQWIRDIRMML